MQALVFFSLGLIFFINIISRIKSRRFSESESLFWILAALLAMASPLYIEILDKISYSIGIEYPPSFLFVLSILFILLLVFRLSESNHMLKEQVKNLAQNYAIMENQLLHLKVDLQKNIKS